MQTSLFTKTRVAEASIAESSQFVQTRSRIIGDRGQDVGEPDFWMAATQRQVVTIVRMKAPSMLPTKAQVLPGRWRTMFFRRSCFWGILPEEAGAAQRVRM